MSVGAGSTHATRTYYYYIVDFAKLGVVAVIASIIFYLAWYVYDFGTTLLGPILGVIVSYGLWYTGAIMGAVLVRKPGSAFLGETLGAFLEAILPTPGGFTNLVYGVLQGLAAELVYLYLGYRNLTVITSALAGAASGVGALIANFALYRELIFEVSPKEGAILVAAVALAYAASGALWAAIVHKTLETTVARRA
ncbi:ECF transporter S component [Aeropyrum camini]|uniref:ECF transporter S component n=1 Tax=Aeropyrum camini TaxID=229980 RepID=UPI000787CD75|nr:ECF transporter S component [Aeropyrum camini]